jgi:hypothetical protein
MFVGRALRRTFVSKKKVVGTGVLKVSTFTSIHWYYSSNIVVMKKLRRISRAWHLEPMEEMINAYKISVGNP